MAEKIEEMDRQRSQEIESLQITDNSIKCQKCGMAVPIVGKLSKPNSNRIAVLGKRIKWLENYSRSNNRGSDDVKQLKAELAELLEEDAKADKLRSLPLYIAAELLAGNSFVQSVMTRSTICKSHDLEVLYSKLRAAF